MKLTKLLILVTIIMMLAVINFAADNKDTQTKTSSDKINWFSYDEGIVKAKEENKHVMIDFTTSWCGYCKKMEREAFSDSVVINLLNNEFVAVRVDGDSQKKLDIDGYIITERDLTRKEFGVSSYPSFWFLKPDGSKLGLEKGYRPTEWMVGALNYVKDYKYDTTRTNQNPADSETKN